MTIISHASRQGKSARERHFGIFTQTLPTGLLVWVSLPHGTEDLAFINRPGKAAVSTRRSLAAELGPLSSDPVRRPSGSSWDIFTVETTRGGI